MSEVKSIVEENGQLKKAVSEIQESLKGYEKDYDELCVENESLKAEIEKLNCLLAEQSMQDNSDEQASAEEDEEAMEEDEEEAMEDEEAMDEEKEASLKTDEQAMVLAKALRELGVAQPISTKPKAVQMTGEEVMAKFASITDPKERGQFYAKHRNQIFN